MSNTKVPRQLFNCIVWKRDLSDHTKDKLVFGPESIEAANAAEAQFVVTRKLSEEVASGDVSTLDFQIVPFRQS